MKIKVILPVSEVPLYKYVTKINGTKQYQIRDRIKIYGDVSQMCGEKKDLTCEAGSRFLVSDDGSISVAGPEREVLVEMTDDELSSFLAERIS